MNGFVKNAKPLWKLFGKKILEICGIVFAAMKKLKDIKKVRFL